MKFKRIEKKYLIQIPQLIMPAIIFYKRVCDCFAFLLFIHKKSQFFSFITYIPLDQYIGVSSIYGEKH